MEYNRDLAYTFFTTLLWAHRQNKEIDVGAFIHAFREYYHGHFVPPKENQKHRQKKAEGSGCRNCAVCGGNFLAKTNGQIYCSARCAQKKSPDKRVVVKKCPVCGKEFIADRDRRKVCSKRCAASLAGKKKGENRRLEKEGSWTPRLKAEASTW